MSLGAGRARLLRMLLAESLLLALAGGVVGLLLAQLATRYLQSFPLPMDVPLRFDVSLDGQTLLFTATVALGAALLAGIGPALRGSKPSLTPALKGSAESIARRGWKISLRSLLVVGQVAAATLLVIGAGLAARSVQASADYDVGLDPDGVAVMWEEAPEEDLAPDELRTHFLDLAQRIEAHPEVEAVALARIAEAHVFMEDFATALVEREGAEPLRIEFNAVTPGYMEMLEIPVVRGRGIGDGDMAGAARVAVVNETFVDRFLPQGDPVGSRFTVSSWFDVDRRQDLPETTLEVVGVVAAPEQPGGGRAEPFFWVSYLQDPPVRAIIHARGRTGAEAVLPIFREEIPPEPGDFTPVEPGSYADYVEYRFLGNRIVTAVLTFLGLFALVLAFIGVFGIVSFAVSQRYREMAIRQALGAGKGEVVGAVLRDGLRGTAAGIVVGLSLAVPLAYLARSSLLGVAPLDPLAVGGGTLFLVLASLMAGVIPARRLRRAEPMTVLREE
jgi:putative ABC transport system permease protein